MTVDDLIGVYIEASNAVVWEAEKRGLCPMTLDMQRAGVTAIVRALAPDDDEVAAYTRLTLRVRKEMPCECEYLPEDRCISCEVAAALACLEKRYHEILGDAGEKVADYTCNGVRVVITQDPPATDAAPAVCEWRGSKDGQLAYMGCTKRLEWTYDRRKCPSCGKSITFTEAK